MISLLKRTTPTFRFATGMTTLRSAASLKDLRSPGEIFKYLETNKAATGAELRSLFDSLFTMKTAAELRDMKEVQLLIRDATAKNWLDSANAKELLLAEKRFVLLEVARGKEWDVLMEKLTKELVHLGDKELFGLMMETEDLMLRTKAKSFWKRLLAEMTDRAEGYGWKELVEIVKYAAELGIASPVFWNRIEPELLAKVKGASKESVTSVLECYKVVGRESNEVIAALTKALA